MASTSTALAGPFAARSAMQFRRSCNAGAPRPVARAPPSAYILRRISLSRRRRSPFAAATHDGDVHHPEEVAEGIIEAVATEPAAGPSTGSHTTHATVLDTHATGANTDLKMALIDSFVGTERGLSANSDARAEINELILQLEAAGTAEPNETMALLAGSWKLLYTANSELLPLLALGRLPLLTVGDVIQSIDAASMTVVNRVALSGPLAAGSLAATAAFEVRSPRRLQVTFKEGRLGIPKLLEGITLPDSLTVLGQSVDLAPAKPVLGPALDAVLSLAKAVNATLASTGDVTFPLPAGEGASRSGESWLLTTYVDAELRIARGDGGSVFVMQRCAAPAA